MSPTDSSRGSGTTDHNAQLTGTNTPLRDRSQPGGGDAVRRDDTRTADSGKPRGQRLLAGDRDAPHDVDGDDSRGNR